MRGWLVRKLVFLLSHSISFLPVSSCVGGKTMTGCNCESESVLVPVVIHTCIHIIYNIYI